MRELTDGHTKKQLQKELTWGSAYQIRLLIVAEIMTTHNYQQRNPGAGHQMIRAAAEETTWRILGTARHFFLSFELDACSCPIGILCRHDVLPRHTSLLCMLYHQHRRCRNIFLLSDALGGPKTLELGQNLEPADHSLNKACQYFTNGLWICSADETCSNIPTARACFVVKRQRSIRITHAIPLLD